MVHDKKTLAFHAQLNAYEAAIEQAQVRRTHGAGGSKIGEHPVVLIATLQDVGGLDVAVGVARVMKRHYSLKHLAQHLHRTPT